MDATISFTYIYIYISFMHTPLMKSILIKERHECICSTLPVEPKWQVGK